MLKIRLQRVGRKNDPSFRVVVTNSLNGPKSGKFIEVLGSYNFRKGEPALKADRINYWLSVGAQTSGTVHNLLVSKKIITGRKINVSPKRHLTKTETKSAEVSDQSPGRPAGDLTGPEEKNQTDADMRTKIIATANKEKIAPAADKTD